MNAFIAWLPTDQRRPVLQRLLIVWAVSFGIALVIWFGHLGDSRPHTFDVSLVYSYAISTFIWLFTDVLRFVFKRALRGQAPHYWPPIGRASLMLLVGIPAGYVLGTVVGDAYAGWSTWDLLDHNPARFKGMALSSAAISAAYVAYFYQRGKAAALENQVTQAKLLLLQSQLEPHMLFNTLANLRALIGSDPDKAVTMLDRLVSFLRSTLQASRAESGAHGHTLGDEFARLGDYLDLMTFRMGPRLTYTLDLPDALASQPVAPLLLQPLVENAIRHGLEPQVHGGSITVSAQAVQGQLCITVQDNGAGCDTPWPFDASAVSGFGLAQLHERIAALHGPAGCIQWLSASGDGTRVDLQWPLTTS